MKDLSVITTDELIEYLDDYCGFDPYYADIRESTIDEIRRRLKEQPEIVRCKDCKHRPTMPDDHTDGFDLDFPDGKCPCQCDDGWYSWYPSDNWFCANGERKEFIMDENIKCPYYQGVCGLKEEYICYNSSAPEDCNIYKAQMNKLINKIKERVNDKTIQNE